MTEYLKTLRKFDFRLEKLQLSDKNSSFLSRYLSANKRNQRREILKAKWQKQQEKWRNASSEVFSGDEDGNCDPAEVIRNAAENAPVTPMTRKIQRKICSFISEKHQRKYSALLDECLNEANNDYKQSIKECNIRRILAPNLWPEDKRVEWQSRNSFRFKHVGRTKNYSRFQKNCRILMRKLFLTHKFVRFVLFSARTTFPAVLNDFSRYATKRNNSTIWLSLIELGAIVNRDLERNAIFLREEWYPKIVAVIRKHYKRRKVHVSQWPQIIECIKTLINRELLDLKLNTFEHILSVLINPRCTPPLKFEAICHHDGLEVQPNVQHIFNAFKNIFKTIANIATHLPAIEPLIDRGSFQASSDFLKVEMNDILMDEFLTRLSSAIQSAYGMIYTKFDEIEAENNYLFDEQTSEELQVFLAQSRNVDAYIEKIDEFKSFEMRLCRMTRNEFFHCAIVNQSKVIVGLREIVKEFIGEIVSKIVEEHHNDCLSICNWFESVKRCAIEAPTSTESLFKNGEFMLYVKNKKLDEMMDDIQKNFQISCKIVNLVELPKEQRKMQIQIVHWIRDIQEIFDQNASQFEIYKNQFEEHLVKVTKKLTHDIDALLPKLAVIDDMHETDRLRQYKMILSDFEEQLDCFDDYIRWINKEEKLFKLPVTQYPIVDELKNYVKPFAQLVSLCIEWLRHYYIWMDGPFEYLDATLIESLVQRFRNDFEMTQKYYRNRIKQDMLGNPVLKFRGQTEDPDVEKHPVPLRLCARMLDWIKGFDTGVYIVQIMCNPALRDRHWREMSDIAGFDLTPNAGTSLRKITKFGIDHLLPNFKIISIGANKELQLQNDLYAMQSHWNDIEFPRGKHKDTCIETLTNVEDIQVLLDDHIIRTLEMRGSAFVRPCETEVRQWYDQLTRVAKTVEEWSHVQTVWLSLLPIFSTAKIRIQMQHETRLFDEVNGIVQQYIQLVSVEPLVMKTGIVDGLLEDLLHAHRFLDEIDVGVNQYLEQKRMFFPRFFFLSDDEVLKILSETKKAENVQCFLEKCFEGIHQLLISDGKIKAMQSLAMEQVDFENEIAIEDAGGCVEEWMKCVEQQMQISIETQLRNCYEDFFATKRKNWLLKWPQMIVLFVTQTFFTCDVHTCLMKNDKRLLQKIFAKVQTTQNECISLIRSNEISHVNRIALRALCVSCVHWSDVIRRLLGSNELDTNDFEWVAHMRYYWINEKIVVRMLESDLNFGYEYLGNFDRIAITPLTERCFRTMICAIEHQTNVLLLGPPATGKSETVKEFARMLAVPLKKFSCSTDLDHRLIVKFLKGMVCSGAWLCFEDFDRINQRVQSVVGQYLKQIMTSMKSAATRIHFNGVELDLNRNFFLCATTNPNSTTRVKLPDNLKTLFRPVAMIRPNMEVIAEIMLYSNGLQNAKLLAKKIVASFRASSDILSSTKSNHFGLRDLVSIIQLSVESRDQQPTSDEHLHVWKSISTLIVPKLQPNDLILFNRIIADIFKITGSGFDVNDDRNEFIRKIFFDYCECEHLTSTEKILQKVIQLYEMMQIRHSLIVVGDAFSGKSTLLKIALKIFEAIATDNDANVKMEIVNPKSVTHDLLFGAYDSVNQKFREGILSSIFRRFFRLKRNSKNVIIFDGPIDSNAMENLNSALDDNRKLCLSSGETIAMNANTSLVFETDDLSQVSPAIITRVGIIFVNREMLDWSALMTSWMKSCNYNWLREYSTIISDYFAWIFPHIVQIIKAKCKTILTVPANHLIMSTLNIFAMILDDGVSANVDDYQKFMMSWIQAATIYSSIWGFGGLLDESSRLTFDSFLRNVWSCVDEFSPPENLRNRIDLSLPSEGILFDYFYIFKQKGTWKSWTDVVRRNEPEVLPEGVFMSTVDTARYSHLLETNIRHGRQTLLVGPMSSGKTTLMQSALRSQMKSSEFIVAPIKFSAKTGPNEAQEQLFKKLVRIKRSAYSPPNGAKCISFIDDFNLPPNESCGSNASVELLRNLFDYSFVYDRNSGQKMSVENLIVLAVCGNPGGSWHKINARVLRHFQTFSIGEMCDETITRIFTAKLMIGLKRVGHAADVIANVNQIVTATLNVYRAIADELHSTPTKSHYKFTLRDVLRVGVGCAMLRKESVENKRIFAKVWFHEAMRVFNDRLIDQSEREFVFTLLSHEIDETFKDNLHLLFDKNSNATSEDRGVVEVDFEMANRLAFGSYLTDESDPSKRRYEEIPNFEKHREIVQKFLDEFNAKEREKLEIVLFDYAIEHLTRICRIISMPGGNGLLIGVGGSGRKSLIRLAAFMCRQSVFQMSIKMDYDLHTWKADLKRVLRSSGADGVATIFLLSDLHLIDSRFLMDISQLLYSGDVPNLWSIDEKQKLLESVRLAAQGGNRNIDVSPADVFAFFVNRCRQNLHLMLCFSPVGDNLRTQIRHFPSLTSCCTIDSFDYWPDEARQMIANRYFEPLDLPASLFESMLTACQYFHTSARKQNDLFCSNAKRAYHVTSSAYMEQIHCYVRLFVSRRHDLMLSKSRFVCGLSTLRKAADAVQTMQAELNELRPKLMAMAENCDRMSEEIEKRSLEASIASEQVRRDELVANIQANAAQAMENECSKDLAQAVPVLEDALEALNTLKPADITLVKSMKNPPSAVKLVMAAVCVMKSIPPDRLNDAATGKKLLDYWGPSQRILGDMGFLQSLKDYDKDDINPEIMKKIRKDFIPHKDFKPHVVAKASSAAEGLCKWVKAIENFEAVTTIVRPKKIKLQKAKEVLRETRKVLNEKRALAEALEATVIGLNEELEKTNQEKERTEAEVNMCQWKLERAEALINSLSEEKRRWTEATATLQKALDNLFGDILMASAFIAYLGPFTAAFRANTIDLWHQRCIELGIPCSEKFSLRRVLGNEVEIKSWSVDGLCAEDYSIENIILMNNSYRRCLLVDPQRQANKWIKRMQSSNRLHVVKLSQSDYFKVLIECMQTGRPLLIEDINVSIDEFLDPLILTSPRVNAECILFGDNEPISVSDKFNLFLTSNAVRPRFTPETSNKMNIINFMLIMSSLQDRLLDIIVAKENPHLREERNQLIAFRARDEKLLRSYEDDVLSAIAESGDFILEDVTAIKKMDESKRFCVEIIERQSSYAKSQQQIDSFCANYESVARHAAGIYSCLDVLPLINPMYQFSLDWYTGLYEYSIENAHRSQDRERRVVFLIESITRNLFQKVCRSLFKSDKLFFVWILTMKILVEANRLRSDEIDFFICGERKFYGPLPMNPNDVWLCDAMWTKLNALEKLTAFEGITESIRRDMKQWKLFAAADENVLDALPEAWKARLTAFQRLILLRIFHLSQLPQAIVEFISNEMGDEFGNPPLFNIQKSFEDSNFSSPLIFILAPENDPMEVLLSFARANDVEENFLTIAMGYDQENKAEELIEKGKENGSWICLQNCHLADGWLPQLENIWQKINAQNTKLSFRLWLISASTSKFPSNLLQNSIKLVYERPRGFQNKLLHSYQSAPLNSTTFYESCSAHRQSFHRLVYSLCFFDAIILERKRYGAVGWNVAYDFDENDLKTSLKMVKTFMCLRENVPLKTMFHLISACVYGGRIVDEGDQRLLETILNEYFNLRQLNGSGLSHPREFAYDDVIQHLQKNASNEVGCEVFGLHSNADFDQRIRTIDELLHSIALTMDITEKPTIEPKFLFDLKQMTNEIVAVISMTDEKVSREIDSDDLIQTILHRELELFELQANKIRSSCRSILDIVRGNAVLTDDMEELIFELLNHRVPNYWTSQKTEKTISAFITEFQTKYSWLKQWSGSNKIPTNLWIGVFTNPRSLLCAAKLEFSRKYEIPFEKVTFDYFVMPEKEMLTAPLDGIYVCRVQLTAAHWNGQSIEESMPYILKETMPAIFFEPIVDEQFQPMERIPVPFYSSSQQSSEFGKDVLDYVWLSTTGASESYWIKCGVSLECD